MCKKLHRYACASTERAAERLTRTLTRTLKSPRKWRAIGKQLPGLIAAVLTLSQMLATPAARAEGEASPTPLGDRASLEDYLRYAALNNAGLEAAFNTWKAALERIPQARALPDPSFTYAYYVVGSQRQQFGVAQMFPWFGKLRLQGDAAAEVAAATEQEYDKAKLALFYRVKAAYHEYWYLAQAIEVTEQHLALVVNLESVARTRLKAGVAPNSTVLQAQVELGKLNDKLRTLESLRQPLVSKLNAALGRPTHLPLPWPRALPKCETSFTDEQVQGWFRTSNPDLRRLGHLAAKAEADIGLAKKNFYPDITLGVDYMQTDEATMPNIRDSGKDPIMALVTINVPLWYGKYRAAEREARFMKATLDADLEDTGQRLAADLELTLYYFRDAERKIAFYGDTLVPKAEQSLKVVQQGFETGSTDFTALIDAQRLLLEFRLAERRAQADRGQRLAEIEMIVNRDLSANADETMESEVRHPSD